MWILARARCVFCTLTITKRILLVPNLRLCALVVCAGTQPKAAQDTVKDTSMITGVQALAAGTLAHLAKFEPMRCAAHGKGQCSQLIEKELKQCERKWCGLKAAVAYQISCRSYY